MTTGAATPGEITHAFSLSGGHLAWAIATGKKRIENRKFRVKPGWYGFGVTMTAHTGVMEDKWYREKYPGPDGYPGFQAFYNMRGKIIGACYVSHSLPHSACKDDEYASDNYPIKNIISKVIPFVSGIPARGNFGTWPLSIEARDDVREQVRRLTAGGHTDCILETNAEEDYPEDSAWDGKAAGAYEDDGGQAKAAPKAKAKMSIKSASKAQTGKAPKPAKAPVTKERKPHKAPEVTHKGKAPIAPPPRAPVSEPVKPLKPSKPVPPPSKRKRESEEAESDDDGNDNWQKKRITGDKGDIRSFFDRGAMVKSTL